MDSKVVWGAIAALVAAGIVFSVIGASGGDSGPSAATRSACEQFRDFQAGNPTDDEVADAMQEIMQRDTTASISSAARNLAIKLESGATSTEVADAVARMDAACIVSDL